MATIRDVAREAGVSIATVSRAFNQSSLVSQATCQQVREVAARLDYWPNGTARSLITNRTHALGVLLPDLYGEFFSEVIRGIDLAARRERFQVLVSSSHAATDTLVAAVRSMRGRIDGLIALVPDAESARAVRDFTRAFPVVALDPGAEIPECGSISIANFDGARAMVRHLIGLGHHVIATVRGPEGNIDAEERLRGYRAALAESRIELPAEFVLAGDFTEESGHQAAAAILALEPRPTAVFAANDCIAIGLMSALRDEGVRVPEDIAMGGFDDIAISRYLNPPLTTVHVDAHELGGRAVDQILPHTRTKKALPIRHDMLSTTLVVRTSCGAALARAVAGGRGNGAAAGREQRSTGDSKRPQEEVKGGSARSQ